MQHEYRATRKYADECYTDGRTTEVSIPSGEGWELVSSCSDTASIFWTWRRPLEPVPAPKLDTREAQVERVVFTFERLSAQGYCPQSAMKIARNLHAFDPEVDLEPWKEGEKL